jgi:hypothetical protein
MMSYEGMIVYYPNDQEDKDNNYSGRDWVEICNQRSKWYNLLQNKIRLEYFIFKIKIKKLFKLSENKKFSRG